MIFIIGAGLFATGAMGTDGCGMKCCCQTGSTSVQPSSEHQMRSPTGCCAGVSFSPCDMQSAKSFEIREIALSSPPGVYYTKASLTTAISTDTGVNPGGYDNKPAGELIHAKFYAPPLYLIQQSFLI